MHLTTEHAIAAQKELCKRSLAYFVRKAWHVIEPATPYTHGKVIDVMCAVLEAVAAGDIRRVVINVPPGTMKSTLVGVMFPAWLWGPCGRPGERFVGVAHEQTLGIRDNLKTRRLVSSPWYQRRWGDVVQLTGDQNEKLNFETKQTGFRAVATPSNITGRRGNFVLIDDPISASNANSPAEREKVNLWFQESLPTRMNDPERSAVILVMQRLHERDPTGFIELQGWGWDKVVLPMRFEPERASEWDWRSEAGELLFPERFPEHVVDELERTLGSYATAGQLQQRPSPREGGMFKRHWFKMVDAVPAGRRSIVRSWDMAATKKNATNDPDYTVGVRMSKGASGDYLIEGAVRLRESPMVVSQTLKATAALDGVGVRITIPQDPGAAGKAQADQTVRELSGYAVSVIRPTGDKSTRATPFSVQAEAGNVSILRTGDPAVDAWIEPFLAEMCLFPAGAHDDQCLVAGTLVATERGDVPIEQVRVGERVLTREGFKRVKWSGCTSGHAEVVTAHLSNGRTLTGTRGHPVWLGGKGFTNLDACADAGYLEECPKDYTLRKSISSFSTASPSADTQTRQRPTTEDTIALEAVTLTEVWSRCIEKFGSSITGQSLRGSTSITLTKTPLTTALKIWSALAPRGTKSRTPIVALGKTLSASKTISTALGRWLLSGIGRRKAESGTDNTALKHSETETPGHLTAPIAERCSSRKLMAPRGLTESGSVLTPARPVPAELKAANESKKPAVSAGDFSTDSRASNSARVFVERVTAGGIRQPVYNLTVEDCPEFYANGVLVHNCDATADAFNTLALSATHTLAGW